jgi:hypothetical protein
MRAPPVRGAGPASWSSAMPLRTRFRKRRGLSEAGPTGGVQLFFDLFVAPLPPIPVALEFASLSLNSREVLTQLRDFLLLLIDQVVALVARLTGHATVMTDS